MTLRPGDILTYWPPTELTLCSDGVKINGGVNLNDQDTLLRSWKSRKFHSHPAQPEVKLFGSQSWVRQAPTTSEQIRNIAPQLVRTLESLQKGDAPLTMDTTGRYETRSDMAAESLLGLHFTTVRHVMYSFYNRKNGRNCKRPFYIRLTTQSKVADLVSHPKQNEMSDKNVRTFLRLVMKQFDLVRILEYQKLPIFSDGLFPNSQSPFNLGQGARQAWQRVP